MNTLTKTTSLTLCPTASQVLPKYSLQMVCAQILWWGVGLTLAYDVAETLFHWPHWLAMSLYGCLMIVSAWLGVRAMTIVGAMLVPALLAAIYFSIVEAVPGSSLFALWTQLMSIKAFEYIGWFLLVLGSFISGHKKRLSIMGIVSLALGAYMMIHFAVSQMHVSGQSNMTFVIVQQGSYFMWLIGVSSKSPRSTREAWRRRAIFVFPRLPVKPFVLLAGTALVVGYDMLAQTLTGAWAYLMMVLPPLAMMLTHKWTGDLFGSNESFPTDLERLS